MLNGDRNRIPVSRSTRVTTVVAVAAASVLIAGLGVAQTFSTLSGSVLDATNRVIPKTTLTLTNLRSQAKYSITSDENGRFEFVGLPAGEYAFEARGIGFATLTGNVTVAGGTIQRDFALEVGSLEETITIAAKAGAPNQERRSVSAARRGSHDPGPCAPSAVGGKIRPPTKVADVRPEYPAHLAAAGTGGVVTLDATIGGDGYIREVRVVDSAHPDLDAAAVNAVYQWEFSSTLLNCDPVEVKMKVTANFVVQP
jgi:TonB family protein